ncbi:hypothetical protein HGRIS_014424 [Hohenbuehelia grisea]|uniref:Glycoside hydrolase family 71 protein n=1 Tax=Hohenbuehelia grisea TaxID=104357 RepID=A0ABR3JTH8_9AGAR
MLASFAIGLLLLSTQACAFVLLPTTSTSKIDKVVVAHFMVCNTYTYSITDWERDFALAASKGIDGFALNIGYDSWYPDKVRDAYIAAANTGGAFKLFISFDMTSFPCMAPEHGNIIREYINTYYVHPNQLLYNSHPLVSTFGGQHCTFGTGNLNDGWSSVLKREMRPNHFIPAFFMSPSDFAGYPVMDGAFNWNSGWPPAGDDITFDRDAEYVNNLGGRSYMAAMSPWFFTHYGANTYNKNFIFRGDDWLVASRWESILEHRSSVDLVEIITWNDYGESHYVGPIEGSQPGSESWVNGFDHTAWLDIMQYYITAFKTGAFPAVSADRIFLWARLYPAGADAPDSIGRPFNWQFVSIPTPWRGIFNSHHPCSFCSRPRITFGPLSSSPHPPRSHSPAALHRRPSQRYEVSSR